MAAALLKRIDMRFPRDTGNKGGVALREVDAPVLTNSYQGQSRCDR